MKRSTCASGSGYVPSDSIGFCVASTRNGAGTRCVSWPIVTWRSCITSSSADCTFAGARLISSASRKLQNTGPELGVEAAGVGAVDARADEVGGHEVGRELQPLERAAEHVGDGLDRERLGEAGHALEQHVAAGEQRDEQALEHPLLADDHALDLEQRGLERGVRLARRVLLAALQRPQAEVLGAHLLSDSLVGFGPARRSSLLQLVGAGAELHVDRTLLAVALHRQLDAIARLVVEDGAREVAPAP